MKLTRLFLLLFICFVTVNGFSQNLVPVNWEFIQMIQDSRTVNFQDGKYRLSRNFTINIPATTQSNTNSLSRDQNGTLIVQPNSGTGNSRITFNRDDYESEFYLYSPTNRGRETLELFFKKKNTNERITMKFERDIQQDLFLLAYMVIDHMSYRMWEGTPPHLLVELGGTLPASPDTNIFIVPDEYSQPMTPVTPPSVIPVPEIRQIVSSSTYYRIDGRISISGSGVLTRQNTNAIANYINRHNPAFPQSQIRDIISTYFAYAETEGVNPDLAIAQMLYATNFLTSDQRIRNYNYGGLDTQGTSWNGRFSTMQQGIMAHIQHLVGYTGGWPRTQMVDPRWNLLRNIGIKYTLAELAGIWAPLNARYTSDIVNIINELYMFR